MKDEILKRESQLRPVLHPQGELFLCDLGDVVLKDDMASMEHPIFALSKKPDMKRRTYQNGENQFEVRPSDKGVATIYDKDILIYAISHLMAAKNAGEAISRDITFSARDFLVFSNRGTGGYSYELLCDALERLDGTRLTTTIKTGGEVQKIGFGLIEGFTVRRKDGLSGRVLEWGVTLSPWLFNAIATNEVLTIHKDYFRLRKPIERRVYEIARKHCGAKIEWSIGLEKLQKKCGSQSPKKRFKQLVKELAEYDHLPDYRVQLNDEMVVFRNRHEVETSPLLIFERPNPGRINPETWEVVADVIRPFGIDKYQLFEDWAEKVSKSGPPDDFQRAFVGYAKACVKIRDKRE